MGLNFGRDQETLVPKRLDAVFQRSQAALVHSFPIRKTACGMWVPTPLPVIARALGILAHLGLLDAHTTRQERRRSSPPAPSTTERLVVDAGAGDGRVAALLTRFDQTRTIYAIERDAALYAQAQTNFDQLRADKLLDTTRVRLLDADYLDRQTYTDCGFAFHQVGLVFNYPDGNEARLAEFVEKWAGTATNLCLLTHNLALSRDRLYLRAQADVEVVDEENWLLSVYGTRGA